MEYSKIIGSSKNKAKKQKTKLKYFDLLTELNEIFSRFRFLKIKSLKKIEFREKSI